MTKTLKSSAISPRKVYLRKLPTGVRLEAEVSPCVFMYAGYPLQVQVALKLNAGNSGGSAIVVDHNRNADTATVADIKRLLLRVRIAPCHRCSTPAFDPTSVQTNRGGLCEVCFMTDLQAEFDREQEAEFRRIARRDRRMKANGMTCRVTAWIHPEQGDDYEIDWYVSKRPTEAAIQQFLREKSSLVFDDWQIVSL